MSPYLLLVLAATGQMVSGNVLTVKDFVKTDLYNALQDKGFLAMIDLEIVPFGNANPKTGGGYSCQHGVGECEGNRWEQCAIAAYPDVTQHFDFYHCMESIGDNMIEHKSIEKCATASKMEYKTLSTCYHGKESKALQKEAFKDTPANHQYVPWVTLNGKVCTDPNNPESGCDDFVKAVCTAYTANGGTSPAAICSQDTARRTPLAVCHKEPLVLSVIPGFAPEKDILELSLLPEFFKMA